MASSTRPLFAARAVRGFADGFASVVLANYLIDRGFSGTQIGAIVTATLLGSAALTLWSGVGWNRLSLRSVLFVACGLMALTGVAFATVTSFTGLLLVAFVGTLNPSGGDVSLFLPTEQSALTERSTADRRTHNFAIYNLCGGIGAALGALASRIPSRDVTVERNSFLVYVVCGAFAAFCYFQIKRLPRHQSPARTPLRRSRSIVLRLSVLFSIDAAGGGLVLQSLLVVYLYQRFGLSKTAVATTFFVTSILSAFSALVSSRLAAKVGLVNTMVFTHLPANLCLILAGIVPNAGAAITLLVVRSLVSAMDVPARQALVMTVVDPEERAAAASVTNVPRSLASASTPLIAGVLLEHTSFGWPLILGGVLKAVYDLLLLQQAIRYDLR